MRILVTGGAGYVGSVCVRELCNAGHQVTVYDNLLNGHREAVDPRARLVEADLSDGMALEAQLRGIDAVMHFAALAEVGESVRDPLLYYRNNLANSLKLLEAMRSRGVRRLIFSSSCAVYGRPARTPITEDMPKDPVNPYGRTKLAMEWMMEDSCAAWELGAIALRYFNAAGATSDARFGEDHQPESHLIPRVLKVALDQAEFISIYGDDYPTPDGTCIRDYVHVEDLAVAHRLALERVKPGRFLAVNLGTGRGASVWEVVEACRRVTGQPIPAQIQGRRAGDPPELYADASLALQILGWTPEFRDLERIIQTAWDWHRAHPNGYRK